MRIWPRMLRPAVWLSVAAVTGSGAAVAQDSSKYYTVLHPEEFEIDWRAFYRKAEQRTAAVRERLPHHLDLAYGEDPKQRLDLYLPEGEVEAAPVFLFLHGGGFREGDRAQYGFVAEPFAAHGIITAVASYRLTEGGHHYPAQPEDARAAVEWLYRQVADYGGDAGAIYVGGHSAGAILAADIGVDRSWLEERGIPQTTLRGIAPISGSYDLRGGGRDYTPSAEAEALASPILHIEASVPRVVVAVGSMEEKYLASSRNFVERLEEANVRAELVVAEGQDHRETVEALGQARSGIFRRILQMMSPPAE
jgi:arylformamidase